MNRLLSLVLLLVAVALAACGGDDGGGVAPATAATGAEEGAFPVTIDSKFGSATIEQEPRRVVALDAQSTDDVLALGIKPVGMPELTWLPGGMHDWTKDALGDHEPTLLKLDTEVPYERIAALRPDLILAPHMFLLDQAAYDRLQQIAPTVHFTADSQEDSWQDTMRRIGQALGRPQAADELVAAAEQELAEVRERTPAVEGATVNIFNAVSSGVYTIHNPRDSAVRFFGELGMELPDQVLGLKGEFGRAVISEERYDLLDADVMVGTTSETTGALDRLERDPLFSRVDAVEQGRFVKLDVGRATSMVYPSALSVPYAVREVLPEVERALGGGEATFPVEIEHKFGTTEVPEEPERVVVVGYTEQDTVLALGVTPVAVREFFGGYGWRERPWAQEALDGAEPEVLAADQLNFEAVAAQRPDLILGLNSGMTGGDYKRLSRIAPTVGQSGDYVDYGMPWQEQTVMIGQALGRAAEARELVSQVEDRFAQAREANPAFAGASAILAYGGPDGYGAYTSQDTRARFLADLGFDMTDEIDEIAGESFYTELSQERFRLIDQDLVVMFGPQDEIEGHEVLGRLDAVEDDRVVYLDLEDQFAGALGFSSVLSLPWLLDEAVPQLAAAVDGDPATRVQQPT